MNKICRSFFLVFSMLLVATISMVMLRLINANKDTFKMYTDMFLTEYIILAIHLNSQGALSDMVLNKVKENANLMV